MKKIFLWIAALLFACCAGAPAAVSAEEIPALVPDFSDDFESDEAGGWIEETAGFDARWSNNVLDRAGELQVDSHLKERAKIVYEDGNAGNKVLYLSNLTGGNSFFYIGPKGDYRYRDFTGSFRVKFLEGNDGWISLNLRKSDNVWYTGCHNMNLVLSVAKDKMSIVSHAYRNMPGTPDILLKEDNSEGYTISYQTYTSQTKAYEGDWFDVRYEVSGSSFKLYLDDVLMVDLIYPSRLVSGFGYVSLNGCTTMAYFDDFRIESHDTEAPPKLETSEPSGGDEDGDDGDDVVTPPSEQGGGCKKGASLTLLLAAGLLFAVKKLW